MYLIGKGSMSRPDLFAAVQHHGTGMLPDGRGTTQMGHCSICATTTAAKELLT